MKFGISLFMFAFMGEVAIASPIKIFFEKDSTRATWVKEIFTVTYQIPEDLIELKEVQKCDGLKERGKLDLCLNDNGDLLVVSVDSGFINESLRIFQAP